jgi:hypothetical protein
MAIVRRRAPAWWLAFVSIAVAMLATANASAREMKVEGFRTVRGVAAARFTDGVVLESGCVVTPLRHAARRNDDGTTRDPSAADLCDDLEDDDGSDLLVAAFLRDANRCSLAPGGESSPARIQTACGTSLRQLHLRC